MITSVLHSISLLPDGFGFDSFHDDFFPVCSEKESLKISDATCWVVGLTVSKYLGVYKAVIPSNTSHLLAACVLHGWRRGVVVTALVVSTKLLYVEPG